MFSYAMRHPWKRANPWTKNNDNLTPIALCCQLGYADMFNEIMELSRVVSNRTVICSQFYGDFLYKEFTQTSVFVKPD